MSKFIYIHTIRVCVCIYTYTHMYVQLGQHNCSMAFQNTCLNPDLHILEDSFLKKKIKITKLSIGITSGFALVPDGRLAPILPIDFSSFLSFSK